MTSAGDADPGTPDSADSGVGKSGAAEPASGQRERGKPGAGDSPTGGASVTGGDTSESGYRRDDYWREEANESRRSDDVVEPDNGFAFQTPEERAKAGDESPNGPLTDAADTRDED